MPPLFKPWSYIALVILIALFATATLLIRKQLINETDSTSRAVIQGYLTTYQKIIEQKFSGYLNAIKITDNFLDTDRNKIELQRFTGGILGTDSSMVSLSISDNKKQPVCISGEDPEKLWKGYSGQKEETTIKNNFLVLRRRTGNNKETIHLFVDLNKIHAQFIGENIYTKVYQIVLNNQQQCIYHPDETKIGTFYPLPEEIYAQKKIQKKYRDKLLPEHSDYLGIMALKSYSVMNYAGQDWVIIGVSPGFEISEILSKQEKSLLWYSAIFLVILVSILTYGIWAWKKELEKRSLVEQQNFQLRLNQEQQQRETLSLKHELLRNGLNSHFLFNTLGNLKAHMETHNHMARETINGLSRLYRYFLKTEGEKLVTLQDEYNFTQTYINILNIRFNNAIRIQCEIPEEAFQYWILPVSLQILIENCAKHNVASPDSPLNIRIFIDNNNLVVKNKLKPKTSFAPTTGKGEKNLKARYAFITDRECHFYSDGAFYIAAIPMLKNKNSLNNY
jgi:hypothetical protein